MNDLVIKFHRCEDFCFQDNHKNNKILNDDQDVNNSVDFIC